MNSGHSKFEYYFGDVDVVDSPDNVAVKEGVVALTGGYDNQGRPVIVFPLDKSLKIQLAQVSENDLVNALIYYWQSIRLPDKAAGLAFLIDFRAVSIHIIDTIIRTINTFKHQYSISVGSVYIIRPQDIDLSNRLKVQVGIKKLNLFTKLFSKHQTMSCFAEFNCNFFKETNELTKYIEQNLLTFEFGGGLLYEHETWIILKQDIDAYLRDIIRSKNKFPDVEEQIRLLNQFEKTDSELNLDEAISWLRRTFDELISNAGLKDVLLRTDDLLEDLLLSTPKYKSMKGNPHLDNYRMLVNAIRAKLVEVVNHFQSILAAIEKKINLSYEFKDVKNAGGETVKWIQSVGIPFFEKPPKIASNLNEAESVARDFHNQIFIQGMKSISKCEEMCKGIQKNVLAQGTSGDIAIDRSQYLHKLQSTMTTFNENLQSRRKLYSEVYQFHLILNRVIAWLKRTIEFLPLDLISYHENMSVNEPLPFGNVWKTRIHQYLLKYPSPKVHHIDLVEKLTPTMKDIDVRNEARLLSYRFRIIMKLLSSSDVTVTEVREVLEWQNRLKADSETASNLEGIETGKEIDENRISLFMKIDTQSLQVEDKPNVIAKAEVSHSLPYHKHSEATEHTKIRTSPHYHKNRPKTSIKTSRSQPKLNITIEDFDDRKRKKDLIQLAEKAVRDSLEDTHLISEKDLRINTKHRDEEELSMILNQLLYDITSNKDSNSRQTSRNPSSLLDLDQLSDRPDHRSNISLQQGGHSDY